MKYILLDENNYTCEIIPDFDPIFPGIPIEKRFTKSFIDELIPVEDSIEVHSSMIYDPETHTFSEPPVIVEEEEPEDELPSQS